MLKVFAFILLVFSQSVLADSDEVYRCGNNTFQSVPCTYTKNKPASQKPESDKQPAAEKTLKETKKSSTKNKPKPLTASPKVEPVAAPTKPLPPVVTKKPSVAAPPAPKPASKTAAEPIVEPPASKPPVTLTEPEPVKVPEPVTAPEPVAPPAEPIATPGPATPPVAAPEPAAEPIKTEEAPTKTQEQLGVCDSLKSGLDNIANQKKNGTGDETDLNRQQKELENVMKSSGC